jgi:hypothetical protein
MWEYNYGSSVEIHVLFMTQLFPEVLSTEKFKSSFTRFEALLSVTWLMVFQGNVSRLQGVTW